MAAGAFLVILAGIFLAFSNGANDNFKGVATLLGSRTAAYRTALLWATVTTFAGSIAAFFLAQKLLTNFSGKGLVPDAILRTESFSASVALASASTVLLATRFGLPISTTHALTGALLGAGLFASPDGVDMHRLFSTFFFPLMASPVLAIAATTVLHPALRLGRRKMGLERESCLCLGTAPLAAAPALTPAPFTSAIALADAGPQISTGTTESCERQYGGQIWSLRAGDLLDKAHFLSSGLVSFARGLNDTPKIAAVLLVGGSLTAMPAIGLVSIAIAIGGIATARRVADTMSFQITEMNDVDGFSANLVTGAIVIGASQLGVPVSTTHVSVGGLFGIAATTGTAHWGAIGKIVLAWLTTLPLAATLSFACSYFLQFP